MSKRFWIIIAVIALAFVGILWANSKKENATKATIQPTNHVEGNTASKVKLVEYGDFQCPVCGAYYPVVKQVYDQYKDKVSFQFRNLPLSQAHQFAFAAARSAQAASNQGKFWEMYDLLYQNQTTWSESNNPNSLFDQYAKQLNLDMTKYQKDFSSSATNDTINADMNAFKKLSDEISTPTFFLNGKKVDLNTLVDDQKAPQVDKFSKVLDDALKANQ